MKIITWNCQGAFRKKADFILPLQPDILVVQECEHPDKLKFSPALPKPRDMYWYSDGGKKGLGLFSYSDYKFELLPEFSPVFRYIIPFRVTSNRQSFTFFAIWAMDNKENHKARYIGQVWLAIDYYKNLLGNTTILIGDFNSNKIWDGNARVGTHSDVVNKLLAYNQQLQHEIQERKAAEHAFFRSQEELQQTENLLQQIVYYFPDGAISVADRDLNYIFSGGELHRVFESDPQDIIGQRLFFKLSDDEWATIKHIFPKVFEGESFLDIEVPVLLSMLCATHFLFFSTIQPFYAQYPQ